MKKHAEIFLLLSFSFTLAWSLTLGFVIPLQTIVSGNSQSEISLLFVPHGVRILAFYFYVWKAVFYLLPSSYLCWALSNHSGADLDPLSPVISTTSCYVGFKAASLFTYLRDRKFTLKLWKFLIFAGATSSLANGIGLSLLQHQGTEFVSLIGYMIGDISGLIVCLLVLMYAFRFARLLSDTDSV